MGKSVLVDQIAAHFIKVHDIAPFLVKPEEPMAGTLRRLAGKAVGKIFWDPKIPYTNEEFAAGKAIIGNKAYIYDCYQSTEWDVVKQEIRVYSSINPRGLVILDPITLFTIGMNMGEVNETLVRIATEFAALAKELNFIGLIFCHLNKPESGVSHERGGKVLSVQFAGSRAMMRAAHAMWGLEGNKDPDLPIEQRDLRYLVLLEDRNFGETTRIPLMYSRETGLLTELIQAGDQDG